MFHLPPSPISINCYYFKRYDNGNNNMGMLSVLTRIALWAEIMLKLTIVEKTINHRFQLDLMLHLSPEIYFNIRNGA